MPIAGEHHPAFEEYCKCIFELAEDDMEIIQARMADRLQVSRPAVSEMIRRLEAEGLVTNDGSIALTADGLELAQRVVRRHRLAERFLTDVLKLSWAEAHHEAGKWEHIMSDNVESALDDLLGSPTTCPHGNPIPGHESGVGRAELQTMVEAAKNGRTATVSRISEKLQGDVEAMRQLRDAGIRPGAQVALTIEDGDVRVDVGGTVVRLPAQDAELVYVAP
ncbi:metal-dependent transcriptional regulator [soil metagenome]